jgi:hypothetical protein
VTFALALLSADEAEELAGTPAATHQDLDDLVPVGAALPHARVAAEPTTGVTRPDKQVKRRADAAEGGRIELGRQPAAGDRLWPWARLRHALLVHARLVALAAVFALLIGFSAGVYLRAVGSGPSVATAAAYGDDQLTGVSLTVTASGRDDRVTLHATVEGLRPNETYYLFVVTASGVAYLVKQWASADGAQNIDQDVAVAIGSLAYFTVVDAAGKVVMLAWCQPGPERQGG